MAHCLNLHLRFHLGSAARRLPKRFDPEEASFRWFGPKGRSKSRPPTASTTDPKPSKFGFQVIRKSDGT